LGAIVLPATQGGSQPTPSCILIRVSDPLNIKLAAHALTILQPRQQLVQHKPHSCQQPTIRDRANLVKFSAKNLPLGTFKFAPGTTSCSRNHNSNVGVSIANTHTPSDRGERLPAIMRWPGEGATTHRASNLAAKPLILCSSDGLPPQMYPAKYLENSDWP
jgi:hypothetical protein